MESRRTDGVLHVRPSERDIADPVSLHDAFEDFILREGERRIAVDLSDVHALTSLMIGALVSLHILAYENVVVLTFEKMNPKIENLFKLLGIDKLLEWHYESHHGGRVGRDAADPEGADGSS